MIDYKIGEYNLATLLNTYLDLSIVFQTNFRNGSLLKNRYYFGFRLKLNRVIRNWQFRILNLFVCNLKCLLSLVSFNLFRIKWNERFIHIHYPVESVDSMALYFVWPYRLTIGKIIIICDYDHYRQSKTLYRYWILRASTGFEDITEWMTKSFSVCILADC